MRLWITDCPNPPLKLPHPLFRYPKTSARFCSLFLLVMRPAPELLVFGVQAL
jgi:hypothetical protein